MKLSGRLVLSYTLIIVITLFLSILTLLVVSRPIQNRLSRIQLASQSRQVARRLDIFLRRGNSIQDINERITNSPLADNNHLILVDRQGIVVADTKGAWIGRTLALDRPTQRLGTTRVGTFQAPDGRTTNFAAEPVGDNNDPTGYVVALGAEAGRIPNIISELSLGFFLAGGVSLFVSLVIGVFIARSIALPLSRIAQAAGAVAAGDYAQRVPESGPPEIRRVSASFNTMAGQVEASQQAMRDFVSNVSHELKTPLTSIKGFSQALMEGAAHDEAARRRAAGIIYEEASRMSRLVEDLLDLARIDSGQVVMHLTSLDLGQILSSTADRLLPQAVEKQIEVVRQWDRLPSIIGDGDRLAQVFTNLLDNALRHTPSGGQITIAAHVVRDGSSLRRMPSPPPEPNSSSSAVKQGPMVQVSISDTGPGIAPDDLARIFERFYQIDKSRKRGGGAGLGLAIIKEIIEAHHGQIDAASRVGAGATFTISLPLTEADAPTLVSRR
ncbi:MAG: HAMP domain-containing protein [Anaerolineaceae bacterium]|nr:HAMP domain-containing protein [Anaerolineaceae bacterium]MCB9098674.1 HAMP domain-containing protein [Anaerolineales bacterium]